MKNDICSKCGSMVESKTGEILTVSERGLYAGEHCASIQTCARCEGLKMRIVRRLSGCQRWTPIDSGKALDTISDNVRSLKLAITQLANGHDVTTMNATYRKA